MSGTEQFTRTIAEYLNLRAATDPLFAPNLAKPHKNIEDCITYIRYNRVLATALRTMRSTPWRYTTMMRTI